MEYYQNMKADLHIHSTYSDGSDSIEEIIEKAKGKKLDAIAIMDHDTLAHMTRIPTAAGIKITAGVEITSSHYKTKTKAHMLGYNPQKPEIITALTQPFLEARNKNSEKQADTLVRHGYRIDIDKLARADGKYLYKQHIMDWLVTTGQAPDMFGEFYKSIFKNKGICAFGIKHVDALEAIRAIKEAGGLAVLAHPGQQQNFSLIPEFVELGLDGLELNHHTHSATDKKTIQEYANRYGLFLTGGSDYHGRYESHPYEIGDNLSEESGAKAILV